MPRTARPDLPHCGASPPPSTCVGGVVGVAGVPVVSHSRSPGRCAVDPSCPRRSRRAGGGPAGRLAAAESSSLHAYVVLSLLTGARTEELRVLAWEHVDLNGRPENNPPTPPSMNVWRSVREGGDTKTRRSRRTLALPQRCVQALAKQRDCQGGAHLLIFPSAAGTVLDRHNVLRAFRSIVAKPGSTLPPGLLASCGTASSRSCRPTA